MAFINERIEDEDINKYNLMELWDKYKADETIKVLNSDKPYSFAIDREKDNWLIYIARVKHESWEPKHQSYTNEHIFILYYDNHPYEVRLLRKKYEAQFSEDGNKVLVRTIDWELKSITPEPSNIDEFKSLLKEALEVYGERGLSSQDKKHVITCDF